MGCICATIGSYSAQTGNISSISYPAALGGGNEVYTYESSGRGRLTTITYPNQDTLSFSWSNQDQISELTFDDGTTVTSYSLSYNGLGKLSSNAKTEDSYEIETWNFTYGPHGLEYAEKVVNSEIVITQDFTTDPNGRILSMTYTEEDAAEGVNGEYYFHYDNFGNTVLLTDADGDRQYAALSNACNGKTVSLWNPNSLEIVNQAQGINGSVSLNITTGLSVIVASSKGSLITTNYNAILAGVNSTRTFCYWGVDGDFLPFSPNKPSFPCYVPADCERLFSDENDGTDMKKDLKENYSNCTLAYYCSRVLDRLSFEEEYEAYIDYLQAQQLPEGEDKNAALENALKHINASVKYDKQANNCQVWLDKHPGCKNNLYNQGKDGMVN